MAVNILLQEFNFNHAKSSIEYKIFARPTLFPERKMHTLLHFSDIFPAIRGKNPYIFIHAKPFCMHSLCLQSKSIYAEFAGLYFETFNGFALSCAYAYGTIASKWPRRAYKPV